MTVDIVTLALEPSADFSRARKAIEDCKERASAHAHDDAVSRAFAVVTALRTPPQAAVFGRDVRVGAGWAALLNGMAADMAAVPAVLAAAEWTGASEEGLLEAVAGGDAAARELSERLTHKLEERDWNAASVLGRLEAALAVGRLFRLDAVRIRNALGIAATEAAGLAAARGTMTAHFLFGKAALDGLEAAVLARDGFTAAEQPLEGRRGLVALLIDRLDDASAPKGNVSHEQGERK